MIIGPRPSLGWVAYLAMAGPWYRAAAVLGILGFLMLLAVQEGGRTLTLEHSPPQPFPPPMMFLPPPSHGHLTALDVCSVEAAAMRGGRVGVGSEQGLGGRVGRQVYVYLWGVSVGPRDVWAHWLARLPKVHLGLLDLPRTVGKSPLKNLAKFSGWTALSSEWRVWAGARVAVLWAAGGVVLPLGVVTTRPVWVEAMGPGSGVVVADPQGKVDPVVLATPAHHPLLTTIAHYLVNGSSGEHITTQGELLTRAVKEACGVDNLRLLPVSGCHEFTLLPAGGAVLDMDLGQMPQPAAVPSSAILLRYAGEPHRLQDPVWTLQLFQTYHLADYCPQTATQVELMYPQHL